MRSTGPANEARPRAGREADEAGAGQEADEARADSEGSPRAMLNVCLRNHIVCVGARLPSSFARRTGMEGSEPVADRFSTQEANAWGGLLGVHGRLMRLLEQDLVERCGISHPEFEILLRLDWAVDHRARQQDLAAASVLTRSGTSRAVERLERLGLVRSETSADDHRGRDVALLAPGSELLATALDGHVPLVRSVFLECFDPDELDVMADGWRRVEARLADRPELRDRRRRRQAER